MGSAAPAPSPDEQRHICCTLSSVVLKLVAAGSGETGVAELLAAAGSQRTVAFLRDTDNWISLDEAVALLEAGAQITGDARFARWVGAEAVKQHAGTQVATLLRSLGSPEAVLRGVTVTATKFSTVTELEAVETSPGRARVNAFARPGFTRHPAMCEWTAGLLSQPPVLFGAPPAWVQETTCQARGADRCRYEVTWDAELAAADPEQRLTGLETQLVAMSARLDSAFATACELISPDDVDTILARIVQRAASAVRAPAYVLAVRPRADGELCVYGHGINAERARVLGDAALRNTGGLGASALCAHVASSRRDYGQLVALYPEGMGFFPQEQQLLTLYARHAAAVLDMTVALDDAAARHEEVEALLALAQALSRGGTREAVARRLTAAVPGVVDCDRLGVSLWEPDARQLRGVASWGLSGNQAEATAR